MPSAPCERWASVRTSSAPCSAVSARQNAIFPMPADAGPVCAATSPAPGIDRSTCVMPPQRQKVGLPLVQALTLESHSSGPEQTRTSRCVEALAGLKIRSVEGRQPPSMANGHDSLMEMLRFLQVSDEQREGESGFEAFSREKQPALSHFYTTRNNE